MILKGFPVEFLIGARHEVLQSLFPLLVDQYHQGLVLALPDTAIQSHTVNPAGHVCLRDSSAKHPFKIHDEVERNLVDVVGIGEDYIFTPSDRL